MNKRTLRLGPLLAVAGAAALLGVIVTAAPGDPPQFSAWSVPVNLGPVVNSWGPYQTHYDACPTISKDGLSLYFRSNRLGGHGSFDIWVSQRDSVEDPWEAPANLGPTINGPAGEFCTTFSPDGHWMIFVSNRAGCGAQDLWISHREDKRNDFGWETPVNLGCEVNTAYAENGPALFEDEATGETLLYYSSAQPDFPGDTNLDLNIWVSRSVSDPKYAFGTPSLVAELNSDAADYQPVLRKDGRELFFASERPGGSGWVDLWTSTRASTSDPWSPPVNLGPGVNSDQYDFHPTLSYDGTTLIFASERGGASQGWSDLWACTRQKLVGPK